MQCPLHILILPYCPQELELPDLLEALDARTSSALPEGVRRELEEISSIGGLVHIKEILAEVWRQERQIALAGIQGADQVPLSLALGTHKVYAACLSTLCSELRNHTGTAPLPLTLVPSPKVPYTLHPRSILPSPGRAAA